MKNKLLVSMLLVLVLITGCQGKDKKVAKQELVELLALAETNIPEKDNMVEVKKDVFILEEQENRRHDMAGNQLKLVNQDGGSTLIASGVELWEVINKDGEDLVYYSDADIVEVERSLGVVGGEVMSTKIKEYSTHNRSLKTYNIQTGEFKILYTIQGEGQVQILKDKVTDKYFATLKKVYHQAGELMEEITLIDLTSDDVVFKEGRNSPTIIYPKYDSTIGGFSVYNNIFYYNQNQPTPILNLMVNTGEPAESSAECMNTIMSYNLISQEKALVFDPMDEYKSLGEGGGWLGFFADIYFEHKGDIYIAVNMMSDGWIKCLEGIYKVNTKTGTMKKIIEEDVSPFYEQRIFQEGNFMYMLRYDMNKRYNIIGHDLTNDQQHILGIHYLGTDNKYLYAYDGEEGLWEMKNNAGRIMDPEELFKNPSKVYRIPIGSIAKENILLEDIKSYFDYQSTGTAYVGKNYKGSDYMGINYMNPIIKEGYISKPFIHNKYGLYQENMESPFYETNDDIVRFEKASISTIEQLKLHITEDALTLDSGISQKINWTADHPDTTLYFTSSNPSVATIDEGGVITAHSPGTTNISMTGMKDGFKRDIQNLHLTVKGIPKVFLGIKPSMIIGNPGEKVKLQYQAEEGSTLEISSPNKALEILESGDNHIEIIIPEENGEIVFSVTKEGYSPNEIMIPIARMGDDLEQVVTHLTTPWQGLEENEKYLEYVRDSVALQGDVIGKELGALTRSPKNNVFTIIKNDYNILADNLWNIKQILNKHMNKAGVIPYREFANSLKINLEKAKDKITIKIDQKELAGVDEELMPLTLAMKDMGVSLGIPLQQWEDLLGNNQQLLIHVVKEDDGINLSFENEKGEEIKTIPTNIEVTLHDRDLERLDKTGLSLKSASREMNIGGHYDEAENGIKAGISAGGHISTVEYNVQYSDISSQDQETQQAITALGNMGLIDSEGEADKTKFRPDDIITRAEFSSMIVKAFYLLDENLETSFSDVKI